MTTDLEFVRSVAVAYRLSQVLYAFVELGIPEQLANGPSTVTLVATKTGTDPDALRRLLTVATTIDLVARRSGGTYALTSRGKLLLAGVENSLSPLVRTIGQSWQWATWGRLVEAVRTGEPVFNQGPHSNAFDYFENMSHVGEPFTQRMTVEAGERGALIGQAYNFSDFHRIVDVGGGEGRVLAQILRLHKSAVGTLTDLSYALVGAPDILREAGVNDRVRVVPGDFRRAVPEGGDLYLLSAILHGLSDAEAARLVRRCFSHGKKVAVVDEVVEPDGSAPTELLVKDLQLMVFTSGRQRTFEEFANVIDSAGGRIDHVIEIRSHEMLMICQPRGRAV